MLSFEERNDFLLRGGLLFESSIESFFGGVDRKAASLDELLYMLLDNPSRCDRGTSIPCSLISLLRASMPE